MASPEAGKVELLPLEGATSGVWRYFGFLSKDGKFMEPDKNKWTSVHCKLCAKVLKYTGNTKCFLSLFKVSFCVSATNSLPIKPQIASYYEVTTNLRYHLEHSHRAEFQALQLAQASEKEAGWTRTAASSSSNRQSITSAFQAQIPIPRSSPQWNKLTDAVCYFIAKDMQPIDTVITIIMFM